MSLIDEVNKRRTFAIISHPDAGKTTLTEKLLLYGGSQSHFDYLSFPVIYFVYSPGNLLYSFYLLFGIQLVKYIIL